MNPNLRIVSGDENIPVGKTWNVSILYDGDSFRPISYIGQMPTNAIRHGYQEDRITNNRVLVSLSFTTSSVSAGSNNSTLELTIHGNDKYEDATATLTFVNFAGATKQEEWHYPHD